MKRTKNTGYTKAELDRLYKMTESWKDTSNTLTGGKDVEFVKDNLRVFYALPVRTARAVSQLARRRRTTPERLIERWVREKLAESA